MYCNICSNSTDEIFEALYLGKYRSRVYFCRACGYISVPDAHWLDEAYTSPIADMDTGLVSRNVHRSEQLASMLWFVLRGSRSQRYVDLAGGYGLLTRLMRDFGFNFYWSDKYANNLFARGFEAVEGDIFDGATALEVAEHLADPIEFFKQALDIGNGLVIFTTLTFEGAPPPTYWWYYSFETGQHISFYRTSTLIRLSAEIGAHFYSSSGLHIYSRRPLSGAALAFFGSSRMSRILSPVIRRLMNSKTQEDFWAMRERVRRTLN